MSIKSPYHLIAELAVPARIEALERALATAEKRATAAEKQLAQITRRSPPAATPRPRQPMPLLGGIAHISEHDPNPIVQLNGEGRLVYTNLAGRQVWGELSGSQRRDMVRLLRRAAAQARHSGLLTCCEMATGKYYFTAFVGPFSAEQHVNVFLFDTSAARRTEISLNKLSAMCQEILALTPCVVYVRDENGHYLFQSRMIQKLRNWAPALPPTVLTPEQAQERTAAEQRDAHVLASGEEAVDEEAYTLVSGEVRWFRIMRRPMRHADGTMILIGLWDDITEGKLARETLERSEKQHRDLLVHTQALIGTHDLNGRILSVNPVVERLMGASSATLEGQHLRELVPPERHAAVEEYLAMIGRDKQSKGTMEVVNQFNEHHYILFSNFEVSEPWQAPYVVAYGQVVTDQVMAARELRRAKREAEANAQAKENFLANITHEIRTPMNGVLGIARQLAKTHLDAYQQELLEIIYSSGRHLLAILNDVLDMAKITSGSLELEQVPFNLSESMRQAMEPLIIQAVEKGIIFRSTSLQESCAFPWVVGDAFRLNQVLLNLVSNAIKFTPPGGSIHVKGVLVHETPTHLTTEFSVRDTGIGIAPDKLESIFENFTQASADTARQFGGTGLGLSISRALVTQLGGQLTVESELGQGSTLRFVVTLPRAENKSEHLRKPVGRAAYDTGALRDTHMLVTEDNKINRSIIRMLLTDWGATVDEAEDGTTAVTLTSQTFYDAVLMDIQMPILSGVEATKQIRQHAHARQAQVPILALTANAFRADRERYLAAGMNDCLIKPFEEAELYNKLVALLQNRPVASPSYNLTELLEMAQGSQDFVRRIIQSFLTHTPITIKEILQAAQNGHWNTVAGLIHYIKPTLEQLHIAGVGKAVQRLMNPPNLPLETDDNWVMAVAQLVRQLEQTLRELPAELH